MEFITAIFEPSFSDLLAAIEQATELSAKTRQHWPCSVRQVAKWLDRPPAVIPARFNAVEVPLRQVHHARVGVTAKTLANHKSNLRAALRWFTKQHDLPQHGLSVSPEWAAFRERLKDRSARTLLSNFIRYCSARGISPNAVDDAIFAEYWRYRAELTAFASGNSNRRQVARTWNAYAAASALQPLSEPPIRRRELPAWEDFPEGLRQEIDAFFVGLTQPHRGMNGRRSRPCQPTTIRTGRAQLAAVARMAVRIGVPISNLTSLSALLHPDVVERVIDAYWEKNGIEPKRFTIDLGWQLLRMARQTGGLDEAALERLDEIRAALEEYRRSGLTPKNLQLIRQVLAPGVWTEVVSLPGVLMKAARSDKDHAPTKAAVTAQLAVAVAILTFAPVRLANLNGIQLGENLTKPGGLNTPYWLIFPHYDVKNQVDLNFVFDQQLTDLIDEYVHDFRPALLRGANGPWLFPGERGEQKSANALALQLIKRIQKATGLRITPHQFRHAAAAIYLKHRPGDYETVRRLLGHRKIQTTIDFYCGLQSTQATEQFGKLIREQIKLTPIS
jgi:integrase